MPQQIIEEGEHLILRDAARPNEHHEQIEPSALRRDRHRADRGDLLPVASSVLVDRGLADQAPTPSDRRIQRESRLIEENQMRTPSRHVFLMRGQSRATHRVTACSSRSIARFRGF